MWLLSRQLMINASFPNAITLCTSIVLTSTGNIKSSLRLKMESETKVLRVFQSINEVSAHQ